MDRARSSHFLGEDAAAGAAATFEKNNPKSLGLQMPGGRQAGEARSDDDDPRGGERQRRDGRGEEEEAEVDVGVGVEEVIGFTYEGPVLGADGGGRLGLGEEGGGVGAEEG